MFAATIQHEIKAARRERLPQLILIVFLFMVAAASFIGWLTHETVTSVYNEALRQGATTQPNPFLQIPQLDPVKNVIIYMALIGALFAVLIGVRSSVRDRKSRVLDLVFSRPVSKRQYVAARFIGMAIWLGVITVIAAVLTWLSLWIVQGHATSLGNTGRLLAFFALSWLFLLPFMALGMMSGMRAKGETTALLVPILVWALVTFVVPQFGTAEEPISFLNPVPAQPASEGAFFQINHQVLQPFSFTDHYKELSAASLHFTDDHDTTRQMLEFALIVGVTVVPLLVCAPQLMRKGELYE